MMNDKHCPTCGIDKPATTEFWYKNTRTGWSWQCKDCESKRGKLYHAANRDEHIKKMSRDHLKRKYGVTPEQRDEMLRWQNDVCAMPGCGATEAGGRDNTWHIDHDHETKQVRGILCWECNIRVVPVLERLIPTHSYLTTDWKMLWTKVKDSVK